MQHAFGRTLCSFHFLKFSHVPNVLTFSGFLFSSLMTLATFFYSPNHPFTRCPSTADIFWCLHNEWSTVLLLVVVCLCLLLRPPFELNSRECSEPILLDCRTLFLSKEKKNPNPVHAQLEMMSWPLWALPGRMAYSFASNLFFMFIPCYFSSASSTMGTEALWYSEGTCSFLLLPSFPKYALLQWALSTCFLSLCYQPRSRAVIGR